MTVDDIAHECYQKAYVLALAAAKSYFEAAANAKPAELNQDAVLDALKAVADHSNHPMLADKAFTQFNKFTTAALEDALQSLAEQAAEMNRPAATLKRIGEEAEKLANELPINQIAANLPSLLEAVTGLKDKAEALKDADDAGDKLSAFQDIFSFLSDFEEKVRKAREEEEE